MSSDKLNDYFLQLNDKLIIYKKNYPTKKEEIKNIRQEMFDCIKLALQSKASN